VMLTVAETAEQDLQPAERIRAEVRAVASALAGDPAMARIVLSEIVGATPRAERARARARRAAAQIIELQLEQYEYWQQRTPHQRRVASLAAMAAIAEPIGDLVETGRLGEWAAFVDPISDFVTRGLLAPER
jgi:hypothetical protein